jgi:hypothetical protein
VGADRGAARAGSAGLTLARTALAAWALATLVACGGGAEEGPLPTVFERPVTTPLDTQPRLGDPGVAVEQAVQACRQKDPGLLRSFVAPEVSDEEIAALLARGSDVRLLGRLPAAIDGDAATVEVRLEVDRDGETEDVERVWELERGVDGVWRFTSLPDCY